MFLHGDYKYIKNKINGEDGCAVEIFCNTLFKFVQIDVNTGCLANTCK